MRMKEEEEITLLINFPPEHLSGSIKGRRHKQSVGEIIIININTFCGHFRWWLVVGGWCLAVANRECNQRTRKAF